MKHKFVLVSDNNDVAYLYYTVEGRDFIVRKFSPDEQQDDDEFIELVTQVCEDFRGKFLDG